MLNSSIAFVIAARRVSFNFSFKCIILFSTYSSVLLCTSYSTDSSSFLFLSFASSSSYLSVSIYPSKSYLSSESRSFDESESFISSSSISLEDSDLFPSLSLFLNFFLSSSSPSPSSSSSSMIFSWWMPSLPTSVRVASLPDYSRSTASDISELLALLRALCLVSYFFAAPENPSLGIPLIRDIISSDSFFFSLS